MEKFKELFFELSTEFINLPPDKIDLRINRRLKLIGEYWDFDFIILIELSDDGKEFITPYSYTAPWCKKPPFNINTKHMPWLLEKIRQGETVTLSRLPDDLPEDAKADRNYWVKGGIKSAIILPYKVGKSIIGGFFFASLGKERVWTIELVRELHHLGESLAITLELKKTAAQMDDTMRFDHLLSEISASYINMPPNRVENVIRKDLGRLGRLMGADRCIFYLADKDTYSFKFHYPFVWWPDEDNNLMRMYKKNPDKYYNRIFENMQFVFDKWSKGEFIRFKCLDELPEEAGRMKKLYRDLGIKSCLSVPISVGGCTEGALLISTVRDEKLWPEDIIPRIRLFGEVFANALARKRSDEALQKAHSQVKQLKKQIEEDNIYLREEIKLAHNFDEIVGKSDALKYILFKVEQVAPTDTIVLISGETGTGKELVARAIHNASGRSNRPLIKVNCATLTPNLIESELFGHEKGAFTGAGARRVGRFELANGATLFLDEIGELPLELQPKLLRVLQDGEFERVGGSRTLKTDARVIAATNRNLTKEMEKGRFRNDLWYRLNTFPISVPPLRKRLEDIPLLVTRFIQKYSKKIGKKCDGIPMKMIRQLQGYSWPGNIRELENIIERAIITSMDGNLQVEVPTDSKSPPDNDNKSLRVFERDHIFKALYDTMWKIEGPNGAAQRLDLKPSTLRNRMKKLNLSRPTAPSETSLSNQ